MPSLWRLPWRWSDRLTLSDLRHGNPRGGQPAGLPYTVVRTFPHDRDAFTQGLQFLDGFLYEGTGLNGRSSIRKVKLETGEVVQRRDVPAQYFGEGIVVWQSSSLSSRGSPAWRSSTIARPSHHGDRSNTRARAGVSPTTAPALS